MTALTENNELRESTTDRNGNPIVGAILDIIDKENSRYKVAVAVAEFIDAHTARKETEARLDAEEMAYRYAMQIIADTDHEFALANLQYQLDKNLHEQEQLNETNEEV